MRDEIKKRFDDYFENLRLEAERAEAAEKARIKREEDGVAAFIEIVETMIKPLFKEMAEYVGQYGVKAEVVQRSPKETDRGVVVPHSIEITFPESMKAGVTDAPHFKLVYSKPEMIVSIFRRTNEYNLPGERLTLDKITKEFLEEEFSKYFVKGI